MNGFRWLGIGAVAVGVILTAYYAPSVFEGLAMFDQVAMTHADMMPYYAGAIGGLVLVAFGAWLAFKSKA